MKYLTLIAVITLGSRMAHAQDVEGFWTTLRDRVSAGDIAKVSGSLGGSVGLNAFTAQTSGATQRRNAPLTWGANAAVNVDLLGIQAPFTLAVQSRNTRYSLPSYSFAGISPSYRWVTLHAGDRNMVLSPYSLSKINFRGGGLELSPGKWTVAGMFGGLRAERLDEAGAIQTGLRLDRRRRARGGKLGYAFDGGSRIEASAFSSEDDLPALADSLGYQSERNLVFTLGGELALSQVVRVGGEVARSSFTRDREVADLTTIEAFAYRADVTFSPGFADLKVGYERVDPEYRTHGSLFLQNDFENVTLGGSVPLFAERLTVGATIGRQRNDLAGDQATALTRLIGSVDIGFQPSERLSASASVSNFNTTTRLKALSLDPLLADSVVVVQTQLGAQGAVQVGLDDAGQHNLDVSAAYQRGTAVSDGELDPTRGTTFALASAGYAYAPEGSAGSARVSAVYTVSETAGAQVHSFGPTGQYSRKLAAERATATLSLAYLRNHTAEGAGNAAATVRLGLGGTYQLATRQSITLSSSLLRVGTTVARPGFTDLQLTLGYGLNF